VAVISTAQGRSGDQVVPVVRSLINGEWIHGGGPEKETISPNHGGVATRVSYSTSAEVDAAIAGAREAQRAWRHLPTGKRAEICAAGVDGIEARADEIAHWVSAEMGKTLAEAQEEVGDILVAIGRAGIEDARRFGGVTRPAWDATHVRRRVQTMYQPIGVTGFISPWNFPTEMLMNCIAALMVGNSCVWKPSEWAPYGPQVATEAFVEGADLQPGLLNLIYGGPEIGEQLVRHDDVGLIAFIGSTVVGDQIARAAGAKRLLLEMGGNGPLVVLEDADVDRAVEAAVVGCFYMAGQVCTASERILVHERVHDEFVEKLTERAQALKVGDALDDATQMGPISEERILRKVVRHVDDACAKGATILTGGGHEGLFFEPTVLMGVTTDMEIAVEETFGPVAPVIKVGSHEEALAIANESQYGLSMSVFTSSLATAFEMAEGLEAGQVNVNAGTNDWEIPTPFGGFKRSGVGRVNGAIGLREFTSHKTITFTLL
jgi:acyl-CoA reductase-like NAD-dependent aldehyde dehydrogenase